MDAVAVPGAARPYSVVALDMFNVPGDRGIVVGEFATLAEARMYARRRMQASIDELRTPGQTSAELRALWVTFGEDCFVVGDPEGYSWFSELDYFIDATPPRRSPHAANPGRRQDAPPPEVSARAQAHRSEATKLLVANMVASLNKAK